MSSRWTEEDLQRHTGKRLSTHAVEPEVKRSKYRNVKVQVDGYTFDSKHEAQHYQELRLREKSGEIHGLTVQVPFRLFCPCKDGTNAAICEYVADFVYIEKGAQIVADTKGHLTAIYKLKRRWLAEQEGIVIREVYRR
jgi:hypothetical protein